MNRSYPLGTLTDMEYSNEEIVLGRSLVEQRSIKGPVFFFESGKGSFEYPKKETEEGSMLVRQHF